MRTFVFPSGWIAFRCVDDLQPRGESALADLTPERFAWALEGGCGCYDYQRDVGDQGDGFMLLGRYLRDKYGLGWAAQFEECAPGDER